MSNIAKKGFNAFKWDFSARISIQVVKFVMAILLVKFLEPSDFGLVAMAMAIVGIGQMFTDTGLGGALIQNNEIEKEHVSSVFIFNITMGLLLTILTYFLSDNISALFKNEKLIPLIEVISIIFIVNSFASIQIIMKRKKMDYKRIAKATFISTMVSSACALILAMFGFGVWALTLQYVVFSVINAICLWYKEDWNYGWKFSLGHLKKLWFFGFRIFFAGIIFNIASKLDVIFIGRMFSVSVLGLYDRAKQLNNIGIVYASESMMSVLFPMLSNVKNDKAEYCKLTESILNIVCYLSALFIGLGYIFSDTIVNLIFISEWSDVGVYLQCLILSSYALPMCSLFSNMLSSRGKSKTVLRLECYRMILSIVNIIFLIILGIDEFLISLIATSFCNVFLFLTVSVKILNLNILTYAKPILLQAVLGIFAFFIAYISNVTFEWENILGQFSFSVVYVMTFFLSNILVKSKSYLTLKMLTIDALKK